MASKGKIHPNEKVRLGKGAAGIGKAALGLGLVCLIISVIWGATMPEPSFMRRFYHSFLLGFTFWLSIAAGALFFVVLQHLVRAKWSVTVRRTAEILTGTFPMLTAMALILVLPMLLGYNWLYEWSIPEIAATDHLVHQKAGWLNDPFFAGRVIGYMLVFGLMARWFFKKSTEQDETGDASLSDKMRRMSAPAIIVFSVVLALTAFDLIMSLEPRWFSTMFGVYYFAGSAIAIFAALVLVPMAFQRSERIAHSVTVEHYHDVGKLLFAFVFFWGYIAFSQFMLIWYANLPEETDFFYHRMFGEWKPVAILLVVGHFAIPFTILMSRWTKRLLWPLALFAVWMLVMHWVDLAWLILPSYSPTEFIAHPLDILCTVGIGGLFVHSVIHTASKVNLIPIKDPGLGESLRFENQ